MKIPVLRDFLLSMKAEEREEFAKQCGTTFAMLQQIYCGYRKCNASLAIEIDKHSKGAVTCELLNSDADFSYLRDSK